MMSTVTRRSLLGSLASIAGAVAAPHVARAAARTMRIAYSNTDESHFGRGAKAFAEAVAADPALGGVLKVERHGNSELGDDPSTLKACINGTLDSVLMANSILSNVVPELGVMNAPFLFRDVAGARAILDGSLGSELIALAATKDVHLLAWAENGLRHITSNQPVRNPSELQGLKIRVPQSEIMLGGFRALGAAAQPLAWSLVRNALVSGEFQAEENSIATIEAGKLQDVQKVLSLTGHVYDPAAFVVSPDVLDDLTEPQKVALAGCARKGAAVTRQLCEAAENDGIARLRAAGMTVIADVDLPAFRKAARPFIDTLSQKYGAVQVKTLLSAV